MKAADTVIDMHNPQIMPEIYYKQQELLTRQAEISFKAGIKEVVDWINKHNYAMEGGDFVAVNGARWQDKLRDWEIRLSNK